MTTPFAPAEAFRTRWLPAAGGHRLFVAEYGRPDGVPVLVLHGGPGSGGSPRLAGLFDPARCRVIVPDQRGAGRSEPAGATRANTTADLLADIERIRAALGLERWFVTGGSWGATLGILHAAAQPARVAGLLLRSPFLARRADLDHFFGGARHRFFNVFFGQGGYFMSAFKRKTAGCFGTMGGMNIWNRLVWLFMTIMT